MIDFNCYIGNWPFHKVRASSFDDLLALHRENGIDYGYISSIESIFYNDPYESEKDLSEKIKSTPYEHVLTVNPSLESWEISLEACLREFDIKGLRIHPGFHGYELTDDEILPLVEVAKRESLPIFVTMRMSDERMTHMMHPRLPSVEELKAFAEKCEGVKVVFCYIKDYEAKQLFNTLKNSENVFIDTTGLSQILLFGDTMGILPHAVYGSGYPLRTLKSTIMALDELSDEELRLSVLNGKAINL